MSTGRLYVGTSGYSYPEWKGSFYPEKLPQSGFLDHYSSVLSSVEINNTFYRFPSESMLEGWSSRTPDGFVFAVKANRGITHKGRLKEVDQLTRDFVDRCHMLGEKLGPILFQLPPYLRRDDDRLDGFLEILPAGTRYAMEFRHESWFTDDVFERLDRAGVALCVSEGEKLDTPRLATGGFGYARLRRDGYSDAELADWHEWLEGRTREGFDVFVYLKHDEAGESPERALRLLEGG